ncbi:MAG: methyltransferase domain-containing protein, partial [Ghiorsea sp.]
GVANHIQWSHQPFQALAASQTFDVILCHAVLEWLDDPKALLEHLQRHLNPQGVVSLMFYNKDALLYHNLIRGNFNKINSNDYSGMKGGLTPPNPLHVPWVEQKLDEYGFAVTYRSGVRVFSDYVGVKRGGNADEAAVLKMELRYSKQQPYVNMGRYIHFICKRKEDQQHG